MKISMAVEESINSLKKWEEFAEKLNRLVDGGYTEITVDLQNVSVISSLAFGTLVASHKKMSGAGRKLVVTNLSDEMRKVASETRLMDILNIQ